MRSAEQVLEVQYLEMRGKILSLAADFDRIERAGALGDSSPRDRLVEALRIAGSGGAAGGRADRAERVQLLLSDPVASTRN
jgi:hypothetical protein